ncbi:MAG: hypothetical protein KOO63_03895 [Bacteroidales bacterium]|nr:hypothetical protein [Candidatus Latescibacterota bacterium]
MAKKKTGIWINRRSSFKNRYEAREYFFGKFAKQLGMKKETLENIGSLKPVEISYDVIFVNREEGGLEGAKAYIKAWQIARSILDGSHPNILRDILRLAFYAGAVMEPNEGIHTKWMEGNFKQDTVKQANEHSKSHLNTVTRGVTLGQIGREIGAEMTKPSHVLVKGHTVFFRPLTWFARRRAFQIPGTKSKFNSAFLLIEFGSGERADPAFQRPYVGPKTTPYKVPDSARWVSHPVVADNMRKYLDWARRTRQRPEQYHSAPELQQRRELAFANAAHEGRKPQEVFFGKGRNDIDTQRVRVAAIYRVFLELLGKQVFKKLTTDEQEFIGEDMFVLTMGDEGLMSVKKSLDLRLSL